MSPEEQEELNEARKGIRYEVEKNVLGHWEVMRYNRSGFGRMIGMYEDDITAYQVASFLENLKMSETS
jgi:hypothetical protein